MRSLSAHPARVKNFFRLPSRITDSRRRRGHPKPNRTSWTCRPARSREPGRPGARDDESQCPRGSAPSEQEAPAAQERERQTGNRRSCRGSWSGMRPAVSSGNSKSGFAAGASCRHSGLLVVPSLPQGSREPRRPEGGGAASVCNVFREAFEAPGRRSERSFPRPGGHFTYSMKTNVPKGFSIEPEVK